MKSFGIKLMLYWWIMFFAIIFREVLAIDHQKNDWLEPDVWSKESHKTSQSSTTTNSRFCNECPAIQKTPVGIESNVTMLYFKRLILLLFNRKDMEYDSFHKHHKLHVRLLVTSHQLEQLEKADNPRALDGLITEIFQNKYMGRCYGRLEYEQIGLKATLYKLWIDMWKTIDAPEVRFILISIFIMACCAILCRHWGISYVTLALILMFLFGFFYTYLECNRELKVNEIIEDLKQREHNERKWSIFGYVKTWFFTSENELSSIIRNLKKSTKINLGFCRPDDVFLKYINYLFLTYLKSLLEHITSTITSLVKTLPFPYNVMAAPMLLGFVAYILKYIFKYVVKPIAWGSYMHSCTNSCSDKALNTQGYICNPTDDKLSGDNLRLFLKAVDVKVSSVEDITDINGVLTRSVQPITQLPKPISSIAIKPSSVQSLNNVTKCDKNKEEADAVDTTEVTLEDITENR